MRRFLSCSSSISSPAFNSLNTLLALSLILLIHACSSDSLNQERIDGKWIVVSAARNGQETETLEDGYFEFPNDSLLRTNIFSSEEEFSYQLKDDKIIQEGGENVVYRILKSGVDSLILATTIRNYDFFFIAIKDTVVVEENELE